MKLIEKVLNLVFPPVCGFCGEINENFLCESCKRKVEKIKISRVEDYYDLPVFFNEHYFMLSYEGEVRDFLLRYKFDEASYMYKSYARLIAGDEVFREKFINKYDCIVSVPVHKKRFNVRGYNQSALIAREVASICGVEYYAKVLVKSRNIVAQSSLDKLERIGNVRGAFEAGKNFDKIKGMRVAVFDDIFTTGATLNECCKVLKEHGVDMVGVFTLANSNFNLKK